MKKKIILIVLSVLILLVTLVKIFIGQFNFVTKKSYNNPIYTLDIGNEKIGLLMEIKKRMTLIPGTLYIINKAYIPTSPYGLILDYGKELNLDINGYYCYMNVGGKKMKIPCTGNNSNNIEKINNMHIDHLLILGGLEGGLSNNLIYDGEYKSNITELLSKKGVYQIEVNLHHDNIESDLYIIIELK